MTVTVFTKKNCVQCNQSKKTLDKNGVAYDTVDVTEDETAYAFVTKTLGYMAAPVVAVRNAAGEIVDSWSGFNPEKLATLAN